MVKNTLNVGRISEGFVLDHIEAGKSMEIYKYLHLDKLDCCVAIIKNAKSNKMGKSDGTELCKRYNSRRQPIRSLRDCLSAVYVPAGDYRSSAVNVLVKLRIEN